MLIEWNTELFAQLTRGMRDGLLLITTTGEILAANPAATEMLGLRPTTATIWDAFDDTDDARTYIRGCARTLQPTAGALRRGERSFHYTGWRQSMGSPNVLLQFDAASDNDRFRLLSQKLQELNAEILHRRRVEHTLRALQGVTAALSAAGTLVEIARAVLAGSMQVLGSSAGAVFRVDDHTMELVAHAGVPEAVVDATRAISLDAALPGPHAARTRRPVVIGSPEALANQFPSAPPIRGAVVDLPLCTRDRVLGVLAFTFPTPRAFTGTEIERMATFADLCAQAMERALLFEATTDAIRRKDEFLAMLGHELRNPIAPIQTAIDLMRLRDPNRFEREREVIARQTRHLTTLVDDILEVTRLERGKITLHRGRGLVHETVEQAIDVVTPSLERRRQALVVDVPRDLVVDVDHERLRQVITNLLDNASKYTEPGGKISVVATREGDQLRLHVRDTGRGIDRELLPRIFDPFEQDVRTGARTPGGLGLGLAIVRGLVELHGGTVEASSAGPGHGSEFVVQLPGTVIATDLAATTTTTTRAARGHSARVLVVDDNLDAAVMLADALADLGYTTRVAADGPSALRIASEFGPDVGLLDLGMPLMDGFELARCLRASQALRAMRLIAITGYGQSSDREATRAAGFDAHLVKPVPMEAVHTTLQALLGQPETETAPLPPRAVARLSRQR